MRIIATYFGYSLLFFRLLCLRLLLGYFENEITFSQSDQFGEEKAKSVLLKFSIAFSKFCFYDVSILLSKTQIYCPFAHISCDCHINIKDAAKWPNVLIFSNMVYFGLSDKNFLKPERDVKSKITKIRDYDVC